MSTFVVVAPLRDGARDEARRLLAGGPPFDPLTTPLERHGVFLTDREVVFVFEGPEAKEAVQGLASDPAMWRVAAAWREVLGGRPRLAENVFGWTRTSDAPDERSPA
jgi:hypothetical protein